MIQNDSLVVEPTHLKNMMLKLDHLPRGKYFSKKNSIWNHHLDDCYYHNGDCGRWHSNCKFASYFSKTKVTAVWKAQIFAHWGFGSFEGVLAQVIRPQLDAGLAAIRRLKKRCDCNCLICRTVAQNLSKCFSLCVWFWQCNLRLHALQCDNKSHAMFAKHTLQRGDEGLNMMLQWSSSDFKVSSGRHNDIPASRHLRNFN